MTILLDSQPNTKLNNLRKQQAKPAYKPDWSYLAEQADLEARRWALTADLARINQALEELGEVGQ